MDLNYKVVNLFPSSIHSLGIDNFDNYKDQLIQETYIERDEDPIGREVSNCGGWQSNEININNCKSETLKDIIVDSVSKLPMLENVSMIIEGWKNINEPNNFNIKHNHPRSDLSGVLWIKTPPNSGNLRFVTPQLFSRYKELDSYTQEFKEPTYSFMTYNFYPKEGTMLIFPSVLQHEVTENKSSDDRTSYSFKIRLIHER